MGITTSQFLAYAALAMGAIGVFLGTSAQMVPIRNSLDDIYNDIVRQGRWAMWASILQMIATVILVLRALYTGDA